jgi:hypothetical protein
MGKDVRGDEGLLGPANAAVLTEITPYVSEYRLFHFSHLSLYVHRSSDIKPKLLIHKKGKKKKKN